MLFFHTQTFILLNYRFDRNKTKYFIRKIVGPFLFVCLFYHTASTKGAVEEDNVFLLLLNPIQIWCRTSPASMTLTRRCNVLNSTHSNLILKIILHLNVHNWMSLSVGRSLRPIGRLIWRGVDHKTYHSLYGWYFVILQYHRLSKSPSGNGSVIRRL